MKKITTIYGRFVCCGNEHELDKGPLFGSSYSDGLGLA